MLCVKVVVVLVSILPLRARVIPLMVSRSIENHKAPPMHHQPHLPLLSWGRVGQVPLLGGVTDPDHFGVRMTGTTVLRAVQRHHLTCFHTYLLEVAGTHACKRAEQIV